MIFVFFIINGIEKMVEVDECILFVDFLCEDMGLMGMYVGCDML